MDACVDLRTLTTTQFGILLLVSLSIVTFGQSAFVPWIGPIAACIGFALFWRVLLDLPTSRLRFMMGTGWFACVQLIQLSWALSHPFLYIYLAYLATALFYGLQFGLLCLLITPQRLARVSTPFLMAGIWTLLEWSRLFILSGFSWNPVGLALTGSSYSLQMVSLVGVFGLSFWVIAINALVLRLWIGLATPWMTALTLVLAAFPFTFGVAHIAYHDHKRSEEPTKSLQVLLVQPHFPIEEWLPQFTPKEAFRLALYEWGRILELVKPHRGNAIDLVVLPENVVPFAAYSPIYTYDSVRILFHNILGPDSIASLPDLETGAAMSVDTPTGKVWMVTNGYVAQGMANWLETNVIAGLEDREAHPDGSMRSYASAFHFSLTNHLQDKYDKRILVPLGEYIPFAMLAPLLETYGIYGSFTAGQQAKIFQCGDVPLGVSICYEETYGNLMRQNKIQGAQVLLNLTNDGWYPNSHLPHQHFEHARPRSVEMGIPLVRACNTGLTCVVDSLGRIVTSLEDTTKAAVLKAEVPLYHYHTLYAQTGDGLVIGSSALLGVVAWVRRRKD